MKEQPKRYVDRNGTKRWLLNGRRHREDGPAIEMWDGRKEWWLHGSRHREDGPAYEGVDGTKLWFLNDQKVHPETLVDLQLSRGVFCYYDEQTQTLHFAENT